MSLGFKLSHNLFNVCFKVAALHGPPGVLALLRARRDYAWFVVLGLRAIEVCMGPRGPQSLPTLKECDSLVNWKISTFSSGRYSRRIDSMFCFGPQPSRKCFLTCLVPFFRVCDFAPNPKKTLAYSFFVTKYIFPKLRRQSR